MITLISGLPGAGKTLFALSWVERLAKAEGRTVYYHGIRDLALPWVPLEAGESWYQQPTGSVIVIDEAQRVFRPRGAGTRVPAHVEALETHRHQGHDLILITQRVNLLDSNLRGLVEQHFHVIRKWGGHKAVVYEWRECQEGKITRTAKANASRRFDWKYPAAMFSAYKSAELHTHKKAVPAKVMFMWATPVIALGLGWVGWNQIKSATDVSKVTGVASASSNSGKSVSGGPAGVETAQQYLAKHEPRVPGLAYTAPIYDRVTAATRAPYPAMCIASAARCRCYTEQATLLAMPEPLCRQLASDGFFVAWDQGAQPGGRRADLVGQEGMREEPNRVHTIPWSGGTMGIEPSHPSLQTRGLPAGGGAALAATPPATSQGPGRLVR